MTAADLIDLLRKLPPDTVILVGPASAPVPVDRMSASHADSREPRLQLWLGATTAKLRIVGEANADDAKRQK
jgi:hypothetical protein